MAVFVYLATLLLLSANGIVVTGVCWAIFAIWLLLWLIGVIVTINE